VRWRTGSLLCAAALVLVSHPAGAARIDTVDIPSRAMGRAFPALVVVPEQTRYDSLRFPVLYLLHGYASGHRSMSEIVDLARAADTYGFFIVCPSAPDSWYFDSPADTTVRFETYVVQEITEWVDSRYRTRADRSGRALCGISMGGHGAFYLAFRHPDLFGAAVSISGVLNLRQTTQPEALARVLGPFEKHAARWDRWSIEHMADSLVPGSLALAIDCGTEDRFLESNRRVHARFLARGIDHDYAERPGGHDRSYWRRALEQELLFISQTLSGSRQ